MNFRYKYLVLIFFNDMRQELLALGISCREEDVVERINWILRYIESNHLPLTIRPGSKTERQIIIEADSYEIRDVGVEKIEVYRLAAELLRLVNKYEEEFLAT